MARKRNTESDTTRLAGATAPAREKFKTTRSKHTTKTSPAPEAEPVVAVEAVAVELTETVVVPEPVAEPAAVVVSVAPTSRDEIAALAYSYWVGRGCQGGSPEEDWLRAEAELSPRNA